MKVLVLALGLVAVGCGADPGSSADGGADGGAAAICRPPTGCTAVIFSGSGACGYDCRGVGSGGAACFPLPDGGVADHGEFIGGVPATVVASAARYAADLDRDPQNCGRCGVRCAGGEVCGRNPDSNITMCYRPR